MYWYWKVRLYKPDGNSYRHAQIRTARRLEEIDIRQNFYQELTGAKMLLEGMSEAPYEGFEDTPLDVFRKLLKDAN